MNKFNGLIVFSFFAFVSINAMTPQQEADANIDSAIASIALINGNIDPYFAAGDFNNDDLKAGIVNAKLVAASKALSKSLAALSPKTFMEVGRLVAKIRGYLRTPTDSKKAEITAKLDEFFPK